MNITRHFVDVGNRRCHYRRCGAGPVLLMIHQSPRSSAEYAALMRQWGETFTCIAPDSPGFGQSDPLPGDPSIDDFADALVDLLDALGLECVPAYGFHSGGIILVKALKRHPERFAALAVGGYAIWTPEEMQSFSDSYLPAFQPQAYGEHLTWLWNRILEQSWFFPWFAVEPAKRLRGPHDDPAKVDAVVREMLDSGDAYRAGYGAVLRAPRQMPEPGDITRPVLITAYDGDPLQEHIDRLGALPAGWAARKVATPEAHQQASLDFLSAYPEAMPDRLGEVGDEGFIAVQTPRFDGLIHWRGERDAPLTVHGPGRALELLAQDGLRIDLPGHGLSDAWTGAAPTDAAAWQAVIAAAVQALGATTIAHEPLPSGDPARLYPDLTPDRFGAYLVRAWSIVRAAHLFSPWYAASAATARDFDPAALEPARLAFEHRALLRSSAAREWHVARLTIENPVGNA